MKKLLLIMFITIKTLHAAASNPNAQVGTSYLDQDMMSAHHSKYTNSDVDVATRKNWYELNQEYKDMREQMVLDDMIDERNAEVENIKRYLSAKRGRNYFEAQKLQAQQAEIARLQAERDRLQRLYDNPIIVPVPARRR